MNSSTRGFDPLAAFAGDGGGNKLPMYVLAALAGAAAAWAGIEAQVSIAAALVSCRAGGFCCSDSILQNDFRLHFPAMMALHADPGFNL